MTSLIARLLHATPACQLINTFIIRGRLMSSPVSIMHSCVNPVTGTSEWVVEDSTYDYHQEIARSAYTDMLHDDERNKMYYDGIRRAVNVIHARGQEARVLDIGTGTGLLSMMAAQCGADTIHACEAFEPIAATAKMIIAENNLAEKIRIIPKRSSDLTVGADGDLPSRANILVAEVFDTELIGEGAVPTYLHAHSHLLEKDCICVPHSATVFAQVVESDLIRTWHRLQPIRVPGCPNIIPPVEMGTCPGAASVHDLQLSRLRLNQFRPITSARGAIDFNFSRGDFSRGRTATIEARAQTDGTCHGVFMWWELGMDTEGAIRLSMAPSWAHPMKENAQWRDHWMQAVYYLEKPVVVKKGEPVHITITHDEFSMWFNISRTSEQASPSPERPICRCGVHTAWSRPRIGMLNDAARMDKYAQVLKKVVRSETLCVSVSDGCLLPLVAARLGAQQVYSLEPISYCRHVSKHFARTNNLAAAVRFLDKRADKLNQDVFGDQKIDILMAEPFFMTSILPWHNLHFWYARTALACHMADGALVLPHCARLRGLALEFDHLWKFHAPVGSVEGFDVKLFDRLVQGSSKISDAPTEPHHLWEYAAHPLTVDVGLIQFDFNQVVPETTQVERGSITVLKSGICHGIALWMEYQLDQDTWVSTGHQGPIVVPTTDLTWDKYCKQGVYFIPGNPWVEVGSKIEYEVAFNPSCGSVHFKFDI